jgi:hypothetical protein
MILETFCECMLMSLSERLLVKKVLEVAFDANPLFMDVS